jgi:PAS domain S-box-containing protein
MVSFFRKILTPPVFENEEKNHSAYLLHVILWGLIIVPIPYVIYTIFSLPEVAARALIQGAASEAINIFLFILLRRGHVRAASFLQVASFWVFFTVSAHTGVGVQGESYLLGYPLVIVIAGLLLGGRAALGVTVLSLLSGLYMVYAEAQGFINTEVNRPALFSWVTSLAIFPMGAILQYLSSRTVKKALEHARHSEEKYKLISEVSSDYTFESVVDMNGTARVIWVAGAFKRMTGYNFEEYLAAGGWPAHVHIEDVEKDDEDMRKLLRNEDVINSEIRTITKNGEIRWEHIFAHPIWDEKENRLVGIIGAVQDVTEQKKAETLLKETLLRQTAILNNIPDMAWLKDLDSRYIAVNEQFAKLSGLKYEDIIGKSDHDIWQKDFADHYREDDIDVVRSGKRKEIEEILQDHTGRQFWIETTKTPIRNSRGEVTGTIGIARDITERKTAEIERERLIAELEAKNAELERFTYTVSHDLKSPLVTITGFLSYLEKDAREGKFDKFQKDLERIQQAAEKMRNLLNDLLELSRIGRIMNEPVEIPFREIVREALAAVEGQLKARGVRVEYEEDAVMIYGDRIRLTEVLQNLLDNAIKFMGDQPEPRIRIGSVIDDKNRPSFFVQDNGIGLDPQMTERIFGLFNKLDPNSQGSGVGLSIVKRIIEVHNGNIWVESQPGKGATFYFNVKERA